MHIEVAKRGPRRDGAALARRCNYRVFFSSLLFFSSQRDDDRIRPGGLCFFSDVCSVCANRALTQGDLGRETGGDGAIHGGR